MMNINAKLKSLTEQKREALLDSMSKIQVEIITWENLSNQEAIKNNDASLKIIKNKLDFLHSRMSAYVDELMGLID